MCCVLVPDNIGFFNRNKEKESIISIQIENKEPKRFEFNLA